MARKRLFILITLTIVLLLSACDTQQVSPTPPLDMPNPASVYCEENGGKVDLREDAAGGAVGMCVFADGSECDEWAYYRGECGPAGIPTVSPTAMVVPTDVPEIEGTSDASASQEIPAPLPIDPSGYSGFWTYTHSAYHFSIMLPEDWEVVETTTSDPLMSGHSLYLRLRLQDQGPSIRMSFRRVGEEALLWPTGVGAGEFIAQGTLDVSGQPVRRMYFVCPNGQIDSVWYHGGENQTNIQRGDLEFGFIFTLTSSYCEGDGSLDLKTLRVGEMIIASLQVL